MKETLEKITESMTFRMNMYVRRNQKLCLELGKGNDSFRVTCIFLPDRLVKEFLDAHIRLFTEGKDIFKSFLANGNREWLYQARENACGVEVELVQVLDPHEINWVIKFEWQGCMCEYLVAFLNMMPGLRDLNLPEEEYHYMGGGYNER